MADKTDQTPETQPEIDTSAALAEISSDLFGQGGEEDAKPSTKVEGEQTEPSGEPSADAAKSAPQTTPETPTEKGGDQSTEAPEGENSQEVQDTGAPKTWTKEALAEWSTISPRVQQEILKREQDFLNGITQYKSGAELGARYDAVVEPFRAVLQAENIDPVQLFQSFAANHYLLSRGTPEQKLELAANLIHGYGIDFGNLINFMGQHTPPDPQMIALQQENERLRQGQVQQGTERALEEVRAFAADPAHPYFDELVNDIAQLMERGAAKSLQEAYDAAVMLNPTVRQKELDRLTAERQTALAAEEEARKSKIASATAADLRVTQTPRNGTVPVGSMDDTLAETLRSIRERS